MNQRKIYRNAAVLFLILVCCSATFSSVNAGQLKRIGVQLYTVRSEMKLDFEGTLKKIAAQGYDEIEFAGLFDRDPKEVRRLVENLGMKIVSSHIDSERLKNDPAGAIKETKLLGAKYLVLAWFPPEQRRTLQDWKNWVILMNRVGEMCRGEKIQFLYHNHDFEFQAVEGVVPFDLLLDTVDRRYVAFELDLYWLKLAGRDPEPLFAKYPKGFPLSHIKDMSKTDQAMTDVGDGRINFAGIFKQSKVSGMRHHFVEHDAAKKPFETLERSINYLRGLRF